jgi:hypothetical protein
MEDIYEEATRGYDVTRAIESRIHGLIRDARSLQIIMSGSGVFVETTSIAPHGERTVLGGFTRPLEALGFVWAWLIGPYGIIRDVRFVKTRPGVYEVDPDALIRDIGIYLETRTVKPQE